MAGSGEQTTGSRGRDEELLAIQRELEQIRADLRNPVQLALALAGLLREAGLDRVLPGP